MKKRLLTLVSCLLVVAMCVSLLAACAKIDDEKIGDEFEMFVWNNNFVETANGTYTVPNKVQTSDNKGDDATIYVKWELGGTNANLLVMDKGEDVTTISLQPGITSATVSYTLKATFVNVKDKAYKDGNGNPYSHTFNCSATFGSTGNSNGGGGGGNAVDPTPVDGDGSQNSPYTVAQALQVISQREAFDYTDLVYVRGVVSGSVDTGSAGDYKFNIVDSGSTNSLIVYYASPNGKTVKTGDVVVVSGSLVKYNSDNELTSKKDQNKNVLIPCTIESVNSSSSSGGQGGGNGGSNTEIPANAQTESFTMTEYANQHNWIVSSEQTQTFEMYTDWSTTCATFNVTATKSANSMHDFPTSGSYWNNLNWRLYSSENATLTVSAKTGYQLVSIKFTLSQGSLAVGSQTYGSDQVITINGSSVTLTVPSGQARVTAIEIVYTVA